MNNFDKSQSIPIWIINHYASAMYMEKAGRHLSFAEHLQSMGYFPIIICSDIMHNSQRVPGLSKRRINFEQTNDVNFAFVKTVPSVGNGIKRVFNMFLFFANLIIKYKSILRKFGLPSVILASSVHPLTLLAGVLLSKKLRVPLIVEIRDLWPESIVAYGISKRKSFLTSIMYKFEKSIYKYAQSVIFTMEGGRQYIIDKKWEKEIDLRKIFHINNGVDLMKYKQLEENCIYEDPDLNEVDSFKVIYTGTISQANGISELVLAAKILADSHQNNLLILIYGDGNEYEKLKNHANSFNLVNIKFKGKIDKKYIPYVLSKSNLNLMIYQYSRILQYGLSLNKSFEYLASGKPILVNVKSNYDYIESNGAGIVLMEYSAESLAKGILLFKNMDSKSYERYCLNAIATSQFYDYNLLSQKLDTVIKYSMEEYRREKKCKKRFL